SSSWLIHVTVVPTGTVSAAGENLKSLMSTATGAALGAAPAMRIAVVSMLATAATRPRHGRRLVLTLPEVSMAASLLAVVTAANAPPRGSFHATTGGTIATVGRCGRTDGRVPDAMVEAWIERATRREHGGERGAGVCGRPAQPRALSHGQRDRRRGPSAGNLRAGARRPAPLHARDQSQGVALPDPAQHVPELLSPSASQPDGRRS